MRCLGTVEEVLRWAEGIEDLIGVGVDTLSCWSTGQSGWRAADLWLRDKYREVQNSIVTPNFLSGSMSLNGMSTLISLRQQNQTISITETHPKVLYWALTGQKYDYRERSNEMDAMLTEWLGVEVRSFTDHEWDATVSGFAAIRGMSGLWTHDLLTEVAEQQARIVNPCGPVNYWWPE